MLNYFFLLWQPFITHVLKLHNRIEEYHYFIVVIQCTDCKLLGAGVWTNITLVMHDTLGIKQYFAVT